MKGIVIPASVKDVGPGIFDGCDALIKITVDPANRYYDSRGDCNSVIDSNTNTLVAGCGTSVIPDTVEYIGKKAFINCRMLKAINLPSTVKEIGSEAFRGCQSVTEATLPETVEEIGYAAFRGCRNLRSIVIPSKVAVIRKEFFACCTSLRTVDLPIGLSCIEEMAFDSCWSLDSISLSTFTEIKSCSFESGITVRFDVEDF